MEFNYIYHKYFVIKTFGWEILNEDIVEVMKLALIEDIKTRYENWVYEKQEYEAKKRSSKKWH